MRNFWVLLVFGVFLSCSSETEQVEQSSLNPLVTSSGFTLEEKAELRKLPQGIYDVGSILIRISTLRQFGGEPLIPLATQVKAYWPQTQLKAALDECFKASEFFAGVPIRLMPAGLTRPAQVAGAFAAVDQCRIRLQNARPDLVILAAAHSSQAANVTQVDAIIASLNSMDRNLTYASPAASFDVPMIGNHGDLELALKSHGSIAVYASMKYHYMQTSLQEIDGAVGAGSSLSDGPTKSIYDYYYDMLLPVGLDYQRHAATWLASLGVVLDSEHQIISQDFLSGSGLRSYDFFRLRRQGENLGAESYNGNILKKVYNFNGQAGRFPTDGMGLHLYQTLFGWNDFAKLAMKDPAADAVERERRFANLINIVFELNSEWVYVDKASGTYQAFHHGLSLPPNVCLEPNVCVPPGGGGTPPPCPEGQTCMVPPLPAVCELELTALDAGRCVVQGQ